MMDILLAPPNTLIVIGAIGLLIGLLVFQCFLKSETGHSWLVWLAIGVVAFYLLWHRGAWLIARIMDRVHSFVLLEAVRHV